MAVNDDARARQLAGSTPVSFLAFDILAEGGQNTMNLGYEQRRALLEALPIDLPPSLCASDITADDVSAIAREQGLEGVVAKLKNRPYEPGRRSGSWIKTPFRRRQDVVIAGWEPGRRGRAGQLGALLVGVHDETGGLRYAGQVGSGFSDRTLAELQRRLAELEDGPVAVRQPGRHHPTGDRRGALGTPRTGGCGGVSGVDRRRSAARTVVQGLTFRHRTGGGRS